MPSSVCTYILNTWFVNTFWSYTQLNDQTILFLTIQFSICYFFVLSLNVEQFHLTHRSDPKWCYHSGPAWTWKGCQWRGTSHSPMIQYYWSLTRRCLEAYQEHSLRWVGFVAFCRDAVDVFYCRNRLGFQIRYFLFVSFIYFFYFFFFFFSCWSVIP